MDKMTVQLEVGHYGIRRDGKRVGPATIDYGVWSYPFVLGGLGYAVHGQWKKGTESRHDIVASGLPWAKLGAKVGDEVQCTWGECHTNGIWRVTGNEVIDVNSLFIITHRAPEEPKIEWGAWNQVSEPQELDCNFQLQRVNGILMMRFPKPKPPVVEVRRTYTTWDNGDQTLIVLTRTNGVVTCEIVK